MMYQGHRKAPGAGQAGSVLAIARAILAAGILAGASMGAVLATTGTSAGQDLLDPASIATTVGIDEIRGGFAFSNLEVTHNTAFLLDTGSFGQSRFDSAQFNVFFRSPEWDVFRWIGSPRPEVGTILSTSGHEDVLYAGLNWHVPLSTSRFYLEGGFGAGLASGYLTDPPPGYRGLGCNTLFHWEYGIGANVTDQVTLTAAMNHVSSDGFCSPNDGINNLGVSVGWKF